MGGKQVKQVKEVSFINENPITGPECVVDFSTDAGDVKDIMESLQSDLQPQFKDVTSGYEIEKEGQIWEKKIGDLRKSYCTIDKTMQTEYDRAVAESSEMFKKFVYKDPPCTSLEAMVTRCYRENPNDTLKCAQAVRDYRKCVFNAKPVEERKCHY